MLKRLQKAALGKTVAIVGLGGLGGYAAAELARLNFKRIILMDGDSFEPANMNRQLYCNNHSMGKNKAVCVAEEIGRFFDGELTAIGENLASANAHLIKDADILLDCTDNVRSRLELEKIAALYNMPLVHAAITSLYGQCSVVFPGDGTLSKIYGVCRPPKLPTLSYIPPTLASIQVSETLKTLAGICELRNKLLILDILTNDLRILNIE
ncbi:MAG: ThiF family adenylyltransferase [Christensenellales bacterium]|jgi:molybdopterin/thiamine biosynthesis adenylyltransferase